ncbi:valine N-monooxygenase 1-like [Mercurialis annua]|uniref:valine N-monooxygenase 1-like n=1 Tax=Mercurialis annua TaxID=3986 RepID=UPI002160E57C|nr:valine N-monooxygenase 1-like [Mercurialis annua]
MGLNITDTPFLTTAATTMATLVIVLISVVVCAIKILKMSTTQKKLNQSLPLPPGPKPWPLIGNIPEIIRYKPTFRWIHQLMKELNTDICLIRLWNTNIVSINCPILANEMLKQNDAVFASRPLAFSAKCMTGGYLTTVLVPYNDQWKKMRKILTSEILSPARHQWLHDKRNEEADNLVFYVHNQYKCNKAVNLRLATRLYSGNVIRKIIFGRRYFGKGTDNGGPGREEIDHVDAVFAALKYMYAFCLSDYLPNILQRFYFDGQKKIIVRANKIIRGYQNPLIDERIRQWKSGERKIMEDLLDVFITLRDSDGRPLLNDDEIKNQLAEVMIASIDNPANAVEWAMAEMLNQPKMLEKATKELDMIVGKERLVQESDIAKLNYLNACAKEAFRLHPVSYFNPPHFAMQDTTLGGYFIPKGSWTYLSRASLGRNPNTWQDPLKFNPERHLDNGEVVLTKHDPRFIIFSTGRRGCVGTLLGSCMTTMLLARMIQCFSWSLPENVVNVDLTEAVDDLSLANPVMAFGMPRLAPHMYPTSS